MFAGLDPSSCITYVAKPELHQTKRNCSFPLPLHSGVHLEVRREQRKDAANAPSAERDSERLSPIEISLSLVVFFGWWPGGMSKCSEFDAASFSTTGGRQWLSSRAACSRGS